MSIETWMKERRVTEVECVVADINGIARGKILPGLKFSRSLADDTLRLPESVFIQTVTGDYPEADVIDPITRDVRLRPDAATIHLVPWYDEPTAQVIADCYHHDGSPVMIQPRHVLKRVLGLYAAKGWKRSSRRNSSSSSPRSTPIPTTPWSRRSAAISGRKRHGKATASRRRTSSTRCSRTSTTGARSKGSTSTR